MLHLVLLPGPDGRRLGDQFDRELLWLDECLGDVVHLTALGDPLDQGTNYQAMLPGKLLAPGNLAETWHAEVERCGGAERAFRAIEHEACQQFGVDRGDLPCLLVTIDGAGVPPEIIPIDRTRVATDDGAQHFFDCLRTVFAADRVRPRLLRVPTTDQEAHRSLITKLSGEFERALSNRLRGRRDGGRTVHRQPAEPGWVYLQDALDRYGVKPSTLQDWVSKGKVNSKKDPDSNQRLIEISSLEDHRRKRGRLGG